MITAGVIADEVEEEATTLSMIETDGKNGSGWFRNKREEGELLERPLNGIASEKWHSANLHYLDSSETPSSTRLL